jgi:hypothetical protein
MPLKNKQERVEQMSEILQAMRLFNSQFPTCVQRINYPVHQGKPNPAHGKYFFVGAVPVSCMADGKSMKYDSEDCAIAAAIVAGATRIQRCDCSFVNVEAWRAGLRLGAPANEGSVVKGTSGKGVRA